MGSLEHQKLITYYYKKSPLLKLLKCYNISSMYLVHSWCILGGDGNWFLFGIMIFEILLGRNTPSIGETFAEIFDPCAKYPNMARKFGILNFSPKVVTMVLNQKLLVCRVQLYKKNQIWTKNDWIMGKKCMPIYGRTDYFWL